jgi:hypothetical protein
VTRYTPLWEQAGSYAASLDRRLLGALWPAPVVIGCAVSVNAGTMNMSIATGTVVALAANGTGSVLCYSDAIEVVTSPTAPGSGSNRYDVVVCQPRGNDLDGGANNDFVFSVVSGTAAASPTVPATPAGAVALAQILVVGGSAALTSANLVDRRWVSQGPGTLLRQASNPSAGNYACATEVAISQCTTPPLYIPTATQLVEVHACFRQTTGVAGEAAIVRIREGTTTAGLELISDVSVMSPSGLQVGTGSGAGIWRTYAPGVGVKQWCITLASVSANQVTLPNSTTFPVVLEVVDMGG